MHSRETLAEMPNSVDFSAKGSDIGSININIAPVNQYHPKTVWNVQRYTLEALSYSSLPKGIHICNLTWILCKNQKKLATLCLGFSYFFVYMLGVTQNLHNWCQTFRFIIRCHGNGDYLILWKCSRNWQEKFQTLPNCAVVFLSLYNSLQKFFRCDWGY